MVLVALDALAPGEEDHRGEEDAMDDRLPEDNTYGVVGKCHCRRTCDVNEALEEMDG